MNDHLLMGVSILCSLLGPGVVAVIVQWALSKRDQRRERQLERFVEQSPAIRRLELELYRQTLFQATGSRSQHECQLDAGREYTRLGGNGPGHIRYQRLADDYRQRLEAGDWNYHTTA